MERTTLGIPGALGAILCALLVAACVPPPAGWPRVSPDEIQTVNVAENAGLSAAEQIDIYRLIESEPVTLTLVSTIIDQPTIDAFVAELDAALPLRPSLRCPDRFSLTFRIADGTQAEFGFSCKPESALLRGEAVSSQGLSVEVSPRFAELVEQFAQ